MKRDFITILALMTALSSCNDDALFEKEMYKNVVALISSDYYNTFEEVVTLSPTGEEATGYIAACTGGTHAPKQDMVIGLEEDLTSLEFYNRSQIRDRRLQDSDQCRRTDRQNHDQDTSRRTVAGFYLLRRIKSYGYLRCRD